MNNIDRILMIDGEKIEFSPEIKERMEQVFNEAVEKQCDFHYLEGIEDVLENMKKHGMSESADIVEKNLVADGIIDVNDDERKTDENRWMNEVVSMIG